MEIILILGFVIGFYYFMDFVGTKLMKKKDDSGANAVVGILFITIIIIIYKLLKSYDDATRDAIAIGIIYGVPIILYINHKKKK